MLIIESHKGCTKDHLMYVAIVVVRTSAAKTLGNFSDVIKTLYYRLIGEEILFTVVTGIYLCNTLI